MNIDFSKLLKSTKSDDIEPRDIFMALPGKDKKNGLNVGKIKTTL